MEKKEIEIYLNKLRDLDQRMEENPEEDGLFNEVTVLIQNLTHDIQRDVKKTALMKDLNFVNKSNNADPEFAKEGDSGFDLRANLTEDIVIDPWKMKMIPTGLYFEVEKGLEIQIRSRSGLAAKNNLFVLNSPGTVDSLYRGEIKILLANLGENSFTVKNGDRIAQGVVCPVYGEGYLKFNKQENLTETARNSDGFGSTGVH